MGKVNVSAVLERICIMLKICNSNGFWEFPRLFNILYVDCNWCVNSPLNLIQCSS